MRFAFMASIIAIGACPATILAQDQPSPVVLEPTSDWVLDYATERCTLFRAFGDGEQETTLRIDSYGSATDFRLMVTGPSIPDFPVPTSEMSLRFTPDTEDRKAGGLNGKVGDQPAISFSASFRPYEDPDLFSKMSATEAMRRTSEPKAPDPAFERQVRTMRLDFQDDRPLTLNVGSMARPLEAVRECLDNLQQSWGLDPLVYKGLTRLAVPKVSTVRRVQRDYPASMARNGTNAFIPVRIMVDAGGNTTDCVIQIEQVEEDFRDAVCSNLARGYEPALDSTGQPVASVFRASVFYLIN